MTKKNYELREVFVPVGLPDLTFVQRDNLERSVKAWELSRNKHLLIFGPSKTGKTSLWKRYIPVDKVVKIACNSETSIENLYQDILENLGTFFRTTETISEGRKSSILGEITSIIPWLAGAGKIGGKIEESREKSQTREYVAPRINSATVIRFLGESKKIIILEDFHYTNDGFRQQLAEDLKAFSDENCPWIIVGVQHKTTNLLSFNVDLSQRIAEIPVENFPDDLLSEIVELGELALNLSFHPELKKRIISEAAGSGSIVQNICQRICMIKKVYNTQDDELFIDNDGVFETACEDIANECRTFYEKAFAEIARGGRSDGSTEKYKWFLRMIAEKDIPQTGLKNTDVFHQLQAMGHNGIDQSAVTAGLKYLPTLLKKNNLPTLVDYDESGKTFYLLDNYMKFVMKWIPETFNAIQIQEDDGSVLS